MSVATSCRFLPASSNDFSTAARDLSRAYNLSLSKSQQLLARIYGFEDYHELQALIKKNVPPGPYADEVDFNIGIERIGRCQKLLVDEFGKYLTPVGRCDFRDLYLFSKPHARREEMRFNKKVDIELDPEHQELSELEAKDYLEFIIDKVEGKSEGAFYLTPSGNIVLQAIRYLERVSEGIKSLDEFDKHITVIANLIENHPKNPYPLAFLVNQYIEHTDCYDLWNEALKENTSLDGEDRELAESLVSLAKDSIALFKQVMPSTFRGQIEPNLASVSQPLDNFYFFAAHYYGGVAALALGDNKLGLKWLKKCRNSNRRDPFGARFYLWETDAEEDD